MRGRLIAGLVAAAVVALPASAAAGGWAIVRVNSTPDGVPAGGTWVVNLEVLQHGLTPLQGVQPRVTVTERRTGASHTVSAKPTGRPGVYRARVVFPRAGEWAYKVYDGFGQAHSYPVVHIGEGAVAGATPYAPLELPVDGPPWTAILAAIAAGLSAAAAAVALRRRMTSRTAG
jgi:hypothetical protein